MVARREPRRLAPAATRRREAQPRQRICQVSSPSDVSISPALFPRTRYQGSKRKGARAIVDQLAGLDYTTVLDAFGGTGAVSYELKRRGKQVTFNDILAFNHQIGIALVENDSVQLESEEIEAIGVRNSGVEYGDFIERNFEGIYFTREENRWLDTAVANIHAIECKYKRAMAWFALCQSAMAKRPYNLFHRRNLYMRTADVKRGFGNKASWDRSFDDHYLAFAGEANRALIDGRHACRAIRSDAMEVEGDFDLVYIDTPYINRSGVGVDYRQFYHFLEGMVRIDEWPRLVDYGSKHRRMIPRGDPWSDAHSCNEMFRRLFDRFRNSMLVVSYRSDGMPAVDELEQLLTEVKPCVRRVEGRSYQYVLSTNRRSREVLLIGTC